MNSFCLLLVGHGLSATLKVKSGEKNCFKIEVVCLHTVEVLIFILIVKIFTRHRADCAKLFVRFEETVVHPASAGTWEQRKSRVKATVQ